MQKHTSFLKTMYKLTPCASCLAMALQISPVVQAAIPQTQDIELEYIQRLYEGEINGISTCLFLHNLGEEIQGYLWEKNDTCQLPQVNVFNLPKLYKDPRMSIRGTWKQNPTEDIVFYVERRFKNSPFEITWQLKEISIRGTASILEVIGPKEYLQEIKNMGTALPIRFKQIINVPKFSPPDYKITLVVDPDIFLLNAGHAYALKSIRLYHQQNLIQELETEAGGNVPHIKLPVWEDLNFDGYPDISLNHTTGTLGDFYTYWIYNPKTQRYDAANIEDGEPVDAWVDQKNKLIVSAIRARAANQAYIQTQHWEGINLVTAQAQSGYFMPVKVDDDLLYCEVFPTYDQEQGIILHEPLLQKNTQQQLSISGTLPYENTDDYAYAGCVNVQLDSRYYGFTLEKIKLVVWEQKNGRYEQSKTYLPIEWQQPKNKDGTVRDEWCPVMPYYDANKGEVAWLLEDTFSDELEKSVFCQPESPTKQAR